MKKLLLTGTICLASLFAGAQTFTEWHDPAVNGINRAPMRAAGFAYRPGENTDGYLSRKQSQNYLSMNGTWRFNWVNDASARPTEFWKKDFNDKGWGTMPVPGVWELNGYGDPQYVNIGYGWRNSFASNPPEVPVEDNHVGSYRREFKIPADWKGKEIFAHFGSVTSNIYLWVNGRFVGYSEDSKLEAEFDITPYVTPGKENLIAFQVFRWCDGSYFEDQDFFRFCGVGRDCYLYARSRNRIADIRVTPDLDGTYTDGKLNVDLTLKGSGKVNIDLLDAEGKTVATAKAAKSGRIVIDVKNPRKWSAEAPYLYKLIATMEGTDEVVPVNVGFRKIELAGNQVLVNGQPVLFKGADRHELDPDGGYVVSPERMEQDAAIMKRMNINAVRTCHYPDDAYWYDLCDRYGLYLVAEANLESHGMGYDEKTLAIRPDFKLMHLERNRRHVARNFNYPSIIFWSMGNEAGDGENFVEVYKDIKATDPSRPVQYERAGWNDHTDIFCPMYYDYDHCRKYSENPHGKPLIQCEYAHAMGNSGGGFREYWDLVRKYPAYQGGFIWDFVDQSIRWKGKDGVEIYAYGGDFNRFDASDNNFCDNGLISPDRVLNPHAYEVAYYYQNIWTRPKNLGKGVVSVYNENFFRPLDYVVMDWEVIRNGRPVASGRADLPAVEPQKTADVTLPLPATGDGAEYFLNVRYSLRNADGPLPAGTVVAYDQLALSAPVKTDMTLANETQPNTAVVEPEVIDNQANAMIVRGENFSVEFSRRSGFMNRYEVNGTQMMEQGTELTPSFWRAPTDNDMGANLQNKYAAWRNPDIRLTSLKSARTADGMIEVTAAYDIPAVKAGLTLTYLINNAGAVRVTEALKATPGADVAPLFRFGMQMRMPLSFGEIEYYGRGPVENYSDRKDSQPVGLYRQTVADQFYPYIRPQENGTKSDVRSWKQLNAGGTGLEFTSDAPFSASALNYTVESLDDGTEKHQRHSPEVEKAPFTNVLIDKVQMGLGCVDSWGSIPQKQYMLPYGDYTFTFIMKPVKHQGYTF